MNIGQKLKLIEASELKTEKLVTEIANQRLHELVNVFVRKRPNKSLKILFGNGTEYVSIQGETFDLRSWADLDFERERRQQFDDDDADPLDEAAARWVIKALMDIDTITNGYKRGSPRNIYRLCAPTGHEINQEETNVDGCNAK